MKPILILLASTALLIPGVDRPTASDRGPGASPDCALGEQAEFQGADSCKKCHFRQHRSWKKTKMAETFEVLKPGKAAEAKKKHGLDVQKDYTKDATCLECHTTGYGKPGGYPALVEGKAWTAEETKRAGEMEGVQCESCHGPGSLTSAFKKDHEDYKREQLVERGLITPDAANCKTCHNGRSPTVDAETYTFDHAALVKDKSKIHQHVPLKKKH